MSELVKRAQACRIIGCDYGAFTNVAARPDFPKPERILQVGAHGQRVWSRADIEAWAKEHGLINGNGHKAVTKGPKGTDQFWTELEQLRERSYRDIGELFIRYFLTEGE